MAEEKPKEKRKKEARPKPKITPGGIQFPYEYIILVLLVVFIAGAIGGSVFFNLNSLWDNVYVSRFVLSMKIVSLIVSSFSVSGVVYVAVKNASIGASFAAGKGFAAIRTEAPQRDEGIQTEWASIRQKLEEASDEDSALIIIQADALVDKVLKMLRFPGDTMGERMKALSTPGFRSADDLWDAHKLRNQIAHEGPRNIHYSDALWAIEKYEKVLRELGMI